MLRSLKVNPIPAPTTDHNLELPFIVNALQMDPSSPATWVESLPFSDRDTTCGTENEFQTVVLGERKNLDLAVTIENSNYYKNLIRRSLSGDTSSKRLQALEKYLDGKKDRIWENSWVRFPKRCLNPFARHIFKTDLKADKTDPQSPDRSDIRRFHRTLDGETLIRIPVSYLLKLSLADAIGDGSRLHPFIRITGEQMMAHFSNDNTSPEIFSFYPVRRVGRHTMGKETARETLIRFLFTQLLTAYAEHQFRLKEYGQKVRVFFSASPPLMQKQLNECIPDSFYRYLFMSPCLSGWTKGEDKYHYMKLCHQVLSRSQINGIAKLKEAGIITTNLVVLPNSSNISLANNGTHISIGSKKLGRLLKQNHSPFNPVHEKYLGDLVIKISEHFLCLFPGIYSASPYRLDFEDFHPEKVLGFLPHQIDYTHLRMIWRRWKRKASISMMGHPVTPFGPVWVDRFLSTCFRLKGDYIPDFRLIDYFVSLMSTHESPSLNGRIGNGEQLKKDLAQMGIFNPEMPLYQLIRNRYANEMGYSGFEHRYFSIFENIMTDMGQAADLQNLITTLAYHYILSGTITHDMIPDVPDIESERRQVFFCSAINLPTFFVKTQTQNLFLKQILSRVDKTRHSRRYKGYTRVRMMDYKLALIQQLRKDGAEIIDNLNLRSVVNDLENRIKSPSRHSTAGKLTHGIMSRGKEKNPMALTGERFNKQAETYYIENLRKNHMREGLTVLEQEFKEMELWAEYRDPSLRTAIGAILGSQRPTAFLNKVKPLLLKDSLSPAQLKNLMFLMILYVNQKTKAFMN